MDALTPSRAALDAPETIALIAGQRSWTFAQIAERARQDTAGSLETPATFIGSSTPDAIFAVYSALQARRPFMPLHPRWSEAEVERARDIVPSGIFGEPGSSAEDPAAILFTSGTSASPKAVVLARRSILASTRAHCANLPFQSEDRWLLMMPIAHVGGLSIVTRALLSRTAIVVIDRFDPDVALSLIAEQRVTLLSVVPTMLSALLERDRAGAMRLPRAVLVGGASIPAELRARAASSGVRVLATYGMTETCSQIATQRPGGRLDPHSADSGVPLPGVELRIVDGRGALEPAGQLGRIQVRGPTLMRGYVAAPTLDPAQWFDTGDEGTLRADGALVVRGRADDTLVTGGENVAPAEVEAALLAQPGVRAAAVVGCADARWGQLVTAVLVIAPGADVAAILGAASASLASFKKPRQFAIVDALPVGKTGKIDRQALLRAIAGGALAIHPLGSVV